MKKRDFLKNLTALTALPFITFDGNQEKKTISLEETIEVKDKDYFVDPNNGECIITHDNEIIAVLTSNIELSVNTPIVDKWVDEQGWINIVTLPYKAKLTGDYYLTGSIDKVKKVLHNMDKIKIKLSSKDYIYESDGYISSLSETSSFGSLTQVSIGIEISGEINIS